MPIVSFSLNEKLIEEIDELQRGLGFSGRSETIRAGIRLLIADSREKEELKGKINAVLMLMHPKEEDSVVSEIKHEFEDVMATQLHNHLRENKCLDVFILEGSASRIKEMADLFRASGRMDYVKLIVA
ncbi:MAG: CopG family ribbon-helix-helix protein [Candidatus Altiarchaeota archaeon]|nr:CopG family ribbon-helix-helix protein [Candidatus Altiarchaeota archaeon]